MHWLGDNRVLIPVTILVLLIASCSDKSSESALSKEDSTKIHRVIVSTDIGGTDPDDFQSMVHLLLYADLLEIEGLISSPYGPGRRKDILEVIDLYEKDYTNLATYSNTYPTANSLRHITKQGSVAVADFSGVGVSSEGSDWIIQCARRDDPRPLYVLVWGGIEDLAQALHDAPDILPKLRVYWIGGPNKKWSPDAYQYIATNHPELWIIESNATYRGWFNGGNQSGDLSNSAFAQRYIRGKGVMANFFMSQLGGEIKMGDTPSVSWLLNGDPTDPSKPGWGGQYIRAWDRPKYLFTEMPAATDSIQEFSILELALPLEKGIPKNAKANLKVENQLLEGAFLEDGTARFRFSPKSAKPYKFEIISNITQLNGLNGSVTAFTPTPNLAIQHSDRYPNWWTDDPRSEFKEGKHIGAKTVSQWREEYLTDFAERINRCYFPYGKK